MSEKAPARAPRRTPVPEERKLDAQRSCRLLLEAAKQEFAAKGFAGARVQDIADRAGVNKQLISYYFGGKEGLYRALMRQWLEREEEINDPAVSFEELIARYLRQAYADPDGVRLHAWHGLTGEAVPEQEQEDLSDLRRRQAEGELAEDLDVATVLMVVMAAVAAPVATPHTIRHVFGMDADSPEFRERYERELRKILRRLA